MKKFLKWLLGLAAVGTGIGLIMLISAKTVTQFPSMIVQKIWKKRILIWTMI